jgi:ferredoxin-thioredoxin reductase catalytic subunit
MKDSSEITQAEIDRRYDQLKLETEAGGYYLNPDISFTKELIKGLMINEKRYGYGACPCRLATGKKADDLDIICPCDYRDPDLTEWDCCYCALFISQAATHKERVVGAIPERRPPLTIRRTVMDNSASTKTLTNLPLPVWRCKVCGYLCAREEPPEICPICKAKKERFEKFI